MYCVQTVAAQRGVGWGELDGVGVPAGVGVLVLVCGCALKRDNTEKRIKKTNIGRKMERIKGKGHPRTVQ